MTDKRGLIFANGDQMDLATVRSLVQPGDWLVAADGGLRHIEQIGLTPHLLIGDLDSISQESVNHYRVSPQTRVEQYRVDKDETDLELALFAALKEGCSQILILGGLGGRLDMTLANIFLLALPELRNVDVRLEDGVEQVFLIHPGQPERVIHGAAGDRVSLLAFGEPARGIRTSGLQYPLRDETLLPERTRGISNVMVESMARISLEAGRVICIHTRLLSQEKNIRKEEMR